MMMPFKVHVFAALLIGLFMHTTECAGQDYVDILYLKNGSVIRGMIIEQVPNESLKIKTIDGSVFVYSMDEVLKFTKELTVPAWPVAPVVPAAPTAPPSNSTGSTGGSSAGAIVRRGFVNITQLSYGLGVGTVKGTIDYGYSNPTEDIEVVNESNYVRFETVNGSWLANGLLSVGLGVGFQYYYGIYEEIGQLPIFADIRILPLAGRTIPVVIFQPGYSFGVLSDSYKINGFGIATGLGLNAYISDRNAFVFSLLYDYQQYKYDLAGFGFGAIEIKESSGTFRISMGLSF
jgi:hypothetical protein